MQSISFHATSPLSLLLLCNYTAPTQRSSICSFDMSAIPSGTTTLFKSKVLLGHYRAPSPTAPRTLGVCTRPGRSKFISIHRALLSRHLHTLFRSFIPTDVKYVVKFQLVPTATAAPFRPATGSPPRRRDAPVPPKR